MADLAIHGGPPVRGSLLPYGHQDIDDDDIEAVVRILRSDWITTGPTVREFEEAFAAGLGPGMEAITTPLTFCATANCVIYQGATPVFADVTPDTMNIDPAEVARRITPSTRAVLPVDFAGHPADLDAILELARGHELVVIEDASHALGAEHRGRRVGSISHMTVFSFHPVKHVTTGEGGMVTTDNPDLAARLRLFRNHGIDSDARKRQASGQWHYEMVVLGYNYRLTDIASALGLAQLRRLDGNLRSRRRIASRYD